MSIEKVREKLVYFDWNYIDISDLISGIISNTRSTLEMCLTINHYWYLDIENEMDLTTTIWIYKVSKWQVLSFEYLPYTPLDENTVTQYGQHRRMNKNTDYSNQYIQTKTIALIYDRKINVE